MEAVLIGVEGFLERSVFGIHDVGILALGEEVGEGHQDWPEILESGRWLKHDMPRIGSDPGEIGNVRMSHSCFEPGDGQRLCDVARYVFDVVCLLYHAHRGHVAEEPSYVTVLLASVLEGDNHCIYTHQFPPTTEMIG